jgi:oligosaccharide repeat unit polymerase
MRIVYLVLLSILLISYGKVFSKVVKNSAGLTPTLGWLVGLAFFVLAPLTVMTLNGGYVLPTVAEVGQSWGAVDLTKATLLIPYLVVWTCMMLVCLVVRIFHPIGRPKIETKHALSGARLERAILITMGLTVLNWMVLVWLAGGLDEFLISHWHRRVDELVERYGDVYVLFDHLALANQILFVSASVLYTSVGLKHRGTKRGFTSLILLFFLLEMVLTGNRMYLAIYLLAFLTSCLLFERKKIIVAMLALSPLLALAFSAWAFVRSNLTEIPDSFTGYVDDDYSERKITAVMDAFDGMGALLLLNVVHDYGERYDYLYGITYSRAATSLIPRKIYPHKPQNFTAMLAERYLPYVDTSVSATAIGEMYANFGPLTLALFPLLTVGIIVLSQWSVRKERKHGLLPAALFVLLVWGARVTLEDNFIEFLLAMSLIWMFRFEKGLWSSKGTEILPGTALPNLAGALPIPAN